MSKKSSPRKLNNHKFKAEILLPASKVGVVKADEQLGLHSCKIYQWRVSAEKKASTSEWEAVQTNENARLNREKPEHGAVFCH
jgi:hypothetical protein